MKIYTKGGDFGMTSTLAGERISKADQKIELQGSIDEINANVGNIRSHIQLLQNNINQQRVDEVLEEIQYHLYLMGVNLSSNFIQKHIQLNHVEYLEKEIDRMTEAMPPQTSFIQYSGTLQATSAHVTRSVTRRVERIFVKYIEGKECPMDYTYINRLSDYFFTLARYANFIQGVADEPMVIRNNVS